MQPKIEGESSRRGRYSQESPFDSVWDELIGVTKFNLQKALQWLKTD